MNNSNLSMKEMLIGLVDAVVFIFCLLILLVSWHVNGVSLIDFIVLIGVLFHYFNFVANQSVGVCLPKLKTKKGSRF